MTKENILEEMVKVASQLQQLRDEQTVIVIALNLFEILKDEINKKVSAPPNWESNEYTICGMNLYLSMKLPVNHFTHMKQREYDNFKKLGLI